MKGNYLRFYVAENRRHGGKLLYEWLLEAAKTAGIEGGSAFRAIAGYGRHGVMHEQHFFELAGEVTVGVEFVVSPDQASKLLQLLKQEGLQLFYAVVPADFGVSGS